MSTHVCLTVACRPSRVPRPARNQRQLSASKRTHWRPVGPSGMPWPRIPAGVPWGASREKARHAGLQYRFTRRRTEALPPFVSTGLSQRQLGYGLGRRRLPAQSLAGHALYFAGTRRSAVLKSGAAAAGGTARVSMRVVYWPSLKTLTTCTSALAWVLRLAAAAALSSTSAAFCCVDWSIWLTA